MRHHPALSQYLGQGLFQYLGQGMSQEVPIGMLGLWQDAPFLTHGMVPHLGVGNEELILTKIRKMLKCLYGETVDLKLGTFEEVQC